MLRLDAACSAQRAGGITEAVMIQCVPNIRTLAIVREKSTRTCIKSVTSIFTERDNNAKQGKWFAQDPKLNWDRTNNVLNK